MSEYTRNVAEAKFSLVICGKALPFDEIRQQLGLEPTKKVIEGEILNRLPEIVAQEDAWFHTIQLSSPGGKDPALLGMLGTINDAKAFLERFQNEGKRVLLRLYVRSDTATLAYSLTPDTISALQKTGFSLEVTSVSWGDMGI